MSDSPTPRGPGSAAAEALPASGTPDQPVMVVQDGTPNFLIRFLWFVFIGWWASGLWAALSWVASITIIGIPLAIWMLNRIPQVATLKFDRQHVARAGEAQFVLANRPQRRFLVRALWYLFVGWWLTGLWLSIAWIACLTLLGLPLGAWMYGHTGKMLTLKR